MLMRLHLSLRLSIRLIFILLSSVVLIHGTEADAQSAAPPAGQMKDTGTARLSVSLFGGWASFSQGSVNDMIRFDNLLLTTPVADGGAGLDKGLDQLTDGLTIGVEVRYRLGPGWNLIAGVERLSDSSRIEFTFDAGSGPQESFLDYGTEGWSIHTGIERSFRFTDELSYHVGAAAVLFPASKLTLAGGLGSLAAIDQEGSVTGVGALLSWTGFYDLGGPLSLAGSIRLRLGDVGEPTDDAGDKLINAVSGDVLTVDWSGVDILFGVMIDLF
jgi:hypothetical protein